MAGGDWEEKSLSIYGPYWIGPGDVFWCSAANGSGLYKSLNYGDSWQLVNGSAPSGRIFVSSLGYIFIAKAYDGVYRSTDGGLNFDRVLIFPYSSTYMSLNWCDEDSEGRLFFATYGAGGNDNARIYRSTDGGENFTLVYQLTPGTNWQQHIHAIEVDPSNDYIYGYVGDGSALRAIRSITHGDSWTQLWSGYPNFTSITVSGSYRVYGEDGALGRIMRTNTDSGLPGSLVQVYQRQSGDIWTGQTRDSGGNIFLGSLTQQSGGYYVIVTSPDNGATWSQVKLGGPTETLGGFAYFSNCASNGWFCVQNTALGVGLACRIVPIFNVGAVAELGTGTKGGYAAHVWDGSQEVVTPDLTYSPRAGDNVGGLLKEYEPANWQWEAARNFLIIYERLLRSGRLTRLEMDSALTADLAGKLIEAFEAEVSVWPRKYEPPDGDNIGGKLLMDYELKDWDDIGHAWPIHAGAWPRLGEKALEGMAAEWQSDSAMTGDLGEFLRMGLDSGLITTSQLDALLAIIQRQGHDGSLIASSSPLMQTGVWQRLGMAALVIAESAGMNLRGRVGLVSPFAGSSSISSPLKGKVSGNGLMGKVRLP